MTDGRTDGLDSCVAMIESKVAGYFAEDSVTWNVAQYRSPLLGGGSTTSYLRQTYLLLQFIYLQLITDAAPRRLSVEVQLIVAAHRSVIMCLMR